MPIGTCSWNYDSWIGLVYDRKAPYSAAYLDEYARKYPTVEVDSWFYRLPSREDATEYRQRTPEGFTFACKVTERVSLTHERSRDRSAPLRENPEFLSAEVYREYCEALEPLKDRIFLAELEFEYLNRQKMGSLGEFMKRLEAFAAALDRYIPSETALPLGIECRNANYLTRDYFRLLKDLRIAPVLSEKQYLPHVWELVERHGDLVGERCAVRLLGGDRKEIEKKTGGVWNALAEPREDIALIAGAVAELARGSRLVHVYVNNHFEGSAPLTIERLREAGLENALP